MTNKGDSNSQSKESQKKLHVLIVEDNIVNQNVLKLNLDRLGHTYDVACNGQEALKSVESKTYHLILMDCNMPVMDGYQATSAIRRISDPKVASIPIIAVTADASDSDKQKCLDAGMDAYLSKPVKSSSLAKIIDSWGKASEIMELSSNCKVGRNVTIDLEVIARLRNLQVLGNEDILKKLIRLFLDSSLEIMALIRQAIQCQDLPLLTAQAHSLKSAAANVGASNLAAICLRLENCEAEKTKFEEIHRHLKTLELEYDRAVSELRQVQAA